MLRRRLALTAAAVSFALSLCLTGIGLWAGHRIVSTMSNQLIRQTTETVHNLVETIIDASTGAISRAIDDLARHDIPLTDPLALSHELHGLLSDEPAVDWLFCANEDGGDVAAGRLEDGTRVFLINNLRPGMRHHQYQALPDGQIGALRKSGPVFDPRQRLWYKRAKQTRGQYWTEPYLGVSEPILGVALSAPVFDKRGAVGGVCGLDLILTRLSQFMQTLRLGRDGRAFIIDGTGQLIASSGGVLPVRIGADRQQLRVHASDAEDAVVQRTARYLARNAGIAEQPPENRMRVFSFDAAGLGTVYAAIDRVSAPGGLSWTIVSALPASNFLGPVQRATYLSLALGMAIVGATLILGFWGVELAFRPLTAVTEAAQAITRGERREVPGAQRTDEIGLRARAFQNMTARLKDTLGSLREQANLLNLTHDSISVHDMSGTIQYLNPAAEKLFGWRKGEAVGKVARELLKTVFPTPFEQLEVELLRTGSWEGELVQTKKDGRQVVVASRWSLQRDEGGAPVAVLTTSNDVTERKRAEEERERLRQLEADLAHINRVSMVGELAASLAHEINQPIAAAVTNARTCLRWLTHDEPDLEEARAAATRIVTDGTRAAEIITRLRSFYAKRPPKREVVDVNEVAGEMLALLRNEASRHSISMRADLAADLPKVTADRVQLQQVFMNLMLNGVDAMHETPGELMITSRRGQEGHVLVSISDTGVGLPAEKADQIFNAFFTTKPQGTGMGLAISRTIIESHGGRLWATANSGARRNLPLHAPQRRRSGIVNVVPQRPPGVHHR